MNQLWTLIENSKNIIFFGGAGTSTESGIPDFRSAKGLYSEKYKDIPPEQILSHDFFETNPDLFFSYITKYLIHPNAMPSTAHHTLVKLEQEGKLKAIITQNIDNLHQKAGSKNVIELHGSTEKNYCVDCNTRYTLAEVLERESVESPTPRCDKCRGIIRPDVVLYGEKLENKVIDEAKNAIANSDLLIVAGTSLTVYPAAAFINFYRGQKLVIINKSETQYNNQAILVINDSIGKVLDYNNRF